MTGWKQMAADDDRKRLERQARSLILSKDISLSDRERINAIMKNNGFSPEEKYSSIIRLIKNAPEKEVPEVEDEDTIEGPPETRQQDPRRKNGDNQRKKQAPEGPVRPVTEIKLPEDGEERHPDINGPTDTHLFIDEIFLSYRKYRFFKKRYLVEKNNMFGLGICKRLIPTKRFLGLMKEVHSFQERLMPRLASMLETILKSESVESPLEYNYLRLFRRWMFNTPFSSVPWKRVKWMDHWGFERELRKYVQNFYSFLRMPAEHRDRVLNLVEGLLREEPDLRKEELLEEEERSAIARKERKNYEKEKYIYEYMGAMRSFIAIPGEADSLLAKQLSARYGVTTLTDFLGMTLEAIVFQRPFTVSELRDYYSISAVNVSSTVWDCSPEKLKFFGKDPESVRRRRAEKLKSMLSWFDTVHSLVNLEENGKNILFRAVDDVFRSVDRVNRDAEETYGKNFIVFLETVVHYFIELIAPILRGGALTLEFEGRQTEGRLFTPEFFSDEMRELDSLNAEIYKFRNNNPTLKLSDEEVGRIMSGRISSMTHVEKLVFTTGSLFYAIASKLHSLYDGFIAGDAQGKSVSAHARPLSPDDMDSPFIPYAGSVIRDMQDSTALVKRLQGRHILTSNLKGGVYIYFMAFCYQASEMCGYVKIREDIARRDQIRRELEFYKEDDSETWQFS